MNQFVALSLPDQMKVDEAISALRRLHSERSIKLFASAVVTKDADGKLSIQEITKEGRGGTAVGALIGALAGLPAGPAAAAIMATGGAAIGNAADLTIEDDFSEFANSIKVPPGGAVIVADVTEESMSDFRAMMQDVGGTVIFTR
jgi:uncharacterized membrane protein